MKIAFILSALVVSFLLWPKAAESTTIVIIRNHNAVYIGADSKRVGENGESLGAECKVKRIGDYFFANAGLMMDPLYDFNIQEIASQNLTTPLPFELQLQNFINAVENECLSYLARIKSKRRELYERVVHGRLNIETVIAGRNINGEPFFNVIKFSARKNGVAASISTPILYNCPGDCADGSVVAMLGQMSNSEKMVDNWARGMMNNPVLAINLIINREIKHNTRVGPPITILEITSQKSTWLQHSTLCSDN